MAKPRRTRPVSGAQVRAYAEKAVEFAEAAASDLDAGRNIAATRLAIHAGINSADAVCGARLGKRAAGEDHDQVLALLQEAGPDGIAPSIAGKAVDRARRCADIAARVASTAR